MCNVLPMNCCTNCLLKPNTDARADSLGKGSNLHARAESESEESVEVMQMDVDAALTACFKLQP